MENQNSSLTEFNKQTNFKKSSTISAYAANSIPNGFGLTRNSLSSGVAELPCEPNAFHKPASRIAATIAAASRTFGDDAHHKPPRRASDRRSSAASKAEQVQLSLEQKRVLAMVDVKKN